MVLHRRWLLLAFGCLAFLLLFTSAGRAGDSNNFSPDMLALQGRWVRADAPYIIELRQGKDKPIQATYFNRRYIHVDKTETSTQDGVQYVLIRLQDVNYAGSTYVVCPVVAQDIGGTGIVDILQTDQHVLHTVLG